MLSAATCASKAGSQFHEFLQLEGDAEAGLGDGQEDAA